MAAVKTMGLSVGEGAPWSDGKWVGKAFCLARGVLPNHVQKPFEAENLCSPVDMLEYLINNSN